MAVTEQTSFAALSEEADRIIVEMLAAGAKEAAIASAAGISSRTLARRRADPDIKRRVSELTHNEYRGYLNKLNALSLIAIDRLSYLMQSAKSQSTQLRAVEMWFTMRTRMYQEVETAAKLRAIEEQLGIQPDAVVRTNNV